jgi:putative transposase
VSRFRFIDAEKTNHPVAMMCRPLKVSPSGFYDWAGRDPSARALAKEALTQTIREIHTASKESYGSPRVHAELVLGHGLAVSVNRVAALMRAADLVGVHRRKRRCLTKADKTAPPAPDLIARDFTAVLPGIKMVGDITCLPTRQGWLYLASVLDLGTRKLLGYAMAEHMRAELVVDAITMGRPAQPARRWGDLPLRPGQYTSAAFAGLAADLAVTLSVGRTGQCWDNALAESFFASLKGECLDRQSWPTRASARRAVVEYIGWFNGTRLHSSLGYLTPDEYEATTAARKDLPEVA